jgi:hypothetical protein
MSYTPLPIVTVALDDLRLDLDNYRIPTRREDEAAALNYLFTSEDVLGTAREIIRDGYFDNEVLIVTKEQDGYVVLEGNRRISALKALQDPTLVPEHESDVRALLKRYAVEAEDLPTEVRVLVATDRDSAAPRIARLHTGLSKRRWSPDQQANYYYSLLNAHTTVDDIKSRYPDEAVVRLIKMAVMRRFLAGAIFSDQSLHGYVSGPALAMSVFEYAYRPKDIAAAIGVTFDKDGFLEPRPDAPEKIASALQKQHLAALEYLMTEFRAGRLNTRSREFKKDTPEHDVLVSRLTGVSQADASPASNPPPAGDGAGTPGGGPATAGEQEGTHGAGGKGSSASTGGGDSSPAARGPNHPDTKDRLTLSGLDYTSHTSVNLQSRYHELRGMNIVTFPAATAMLLRSVLETTIKFHFEGTSTPATGELTPSVAVLAAAYGTDRPIKQQIGQIKSGTALVPGSVQWFNLVSHSADSVVTADHVRQAWKMVEPVLRRLLRPA